MSLKLKAEVTEVKEQVSNLQKAVAGLSQQPHNVGPLAEHLSSLSKAVAHLEQRMEVVEKKPAKRKPGRPKSA